MLRFELEQTVVGVQKPIVQIVPPVVVAKLPVAGILAPVAVVAFLPAGKARIADFVLSETYPVSFWPP